MVRKPALMRKRLNFCLECDAKGSLAFMREGAGLSPIAYAWTTDGNIFQFLQEGKREQSFLTPCILPAGSRQARLK